jgi:hypothetical protein
VPIEVYSMRPNVPHTLENEREGEPWNRRSPHMISRLRARRHGITSCHSASSR